MARLQRLLPAFYFCSFFFIGVHSQISFGNEEPVKSQEESTTANPQDIDVVTRFGLVADVLDVHPLGQQPRGPGNNPAGQNPPVNNNGRLNQDNCCCTSSSTCPSLIDDDSFGSIKPRGKEESSEASKEEKFEDPRSDLELALDIGTRIVNNPTFDQVQESCPPGTRQCCYDPSTVSRVNGFGSSCVPRSHFGGSGGPLNVFWQQGCRENVIQSRGKQCGQRNFKPLFNLQKGQASPEEFPWTCLMLTDKDRFLGSCAIVPESTDNNIGSGTFRVITAAHKLASLKKEEGLKVRIIEYDASGIKESERNPHQDYFVVRFITHPQFNAKRLSNDIAVLILERPIDLVGTNGVNAACLPACNNMFDYKFGNGTGVRCWVAGWGKDAEDGQFSFIQRKVDVPLYDRNRCELRLKQELGGNSAARFNLHPGEICAGGEEGKDACDGDGGAPLVCQAQSGHWHVVGLVAWGVGCASPDVPGVYVNVYHYLDFINAASHRRGSNQ